MIEFDVKIQAGDLYDYMMRHTYNGFSGLFGSLIGALLTVAGVYTKNWMMLIGGIVLLCYLPWTLFLKSRQQLLINPAFKNPLHYRLDDEGIHVSQNGEEEMQSWDNIVKVVSTGRSLIVYTSKVNACIFPRRDLKDYTPQVIEMLSTHLPANKVKVRQ